MKWRRLGGRGWPRTRPGALRGRQPEAGIVAVGRRAVWIVTDHPMDDAYGAGSPLAKLVETDGQVLMLGAPLSTLTLLHHAEGAFPYELVADEVAATPGVGPDQDPFEAIARQALAAGIGTEGRVGAARSALFPARALHRFAETWLEARFGDGTTSGG